MSIPTEPIGSIPRPVELIDTALAVQAGTASPAELEAMFDAAVRDTLAEFDATGSPVVSDGEQRKFQSFWTYSIQGLPDLDAHGFEIPFNVGHIRQMPRLTRGPFRYRTYAYQHMDVAARHTARPLKQAVISPSALSLLYPIEGIDGYSREAFLDDLLAEHEKEVRGCLERGAHTVQIDFTEARLALKIDASGHLLQSFIDLNNLALERFTDAERRRIGVHTCPGGDRDSTHSADVDYAELLPVLFSLDASRFFIQLASEPDRPRVLAFIRDHLRPGQQAFVGVINPLDPRVETPEEVCERVLEAAEFIPLAQLGTTDDCGFAPFSDDRSTSRATAFAKIRARVQGTAMAAARLGMPDQ